MSEYNLKFDATFAEGDADLVARVAVILTEAKSEILMAENSRLTAEVARLTAELEKLQGERDYQDGKIDSIRASYEELQAELQQAREALSVLILQAEDAFLLCGFNIAPDAPTPAAFSLRKARAALPTQPEQEATE